MRKQLVGLDIGYSQVKLCYGTDYADRRELALPAGVAPIDQLLTTFDGALEKGGGEIVALGDMRYGALMDPGLVDGEGRLLRADYPSTDEYRALFLAVLQRLGVARIDHLVTGLPVAQAISKEGRARLVAMMRGEHNLANGKVHVDRVTVLPQPAGSWLAAANEHSDLSQPGIRALVMDAGHFSVDWILLNNGRIVKSSSGSSYNAGSAVLEQAAQDIGAKFRASIAPLRIENAIRAKQTTIRVQTNTIEIAPFMERAAATQARVVINKVLADLRKDSHTVDVIVMTGGGSPFFNASILAAFPDASIRNITQPAMGNARGFFYYADAAPMSQGAAA